MRPLTFDPHPPPTTFQALSVSCYLVSSSAVLQLKAALRALNPSTCCMCLVPRAHSESSSLLLAGFALTYARRASHASDNILPSYAQSNMSRDCELSIREQGLTLATVQECHLRTQWPVGNTEGPP